MRNIFTLLIVLGLLVLPKISYADWGWGNHGSHIYFRYHDHPHWGVHVNAFYPNEYYPVLVGGTRYYYDDGIYYGYVGGAYVVAEPPIGAVVSTIPTDFQPETINGVTYYVDNGTYYVRTSSGYQVVTAPAQPIMQSAVTINVPNNRGGYVSVILKRSGNGYVGPQGEHYSQFPNVAQLQGIYGR